MAASKKSQQTSDQSPTASSILSPLNLRPRRNSTYSLTSQMDKETVAHALDQIHSSASRSESLTTFNDFTSPPLPSSEESGTSLLNQAPSSGLSSIYTRLKASVAGPKDPPLAPPSQATESQSDHQPSAKPQTHKPTTLPLKNTDRAAPSAAVVSTPVTPRTPQSLSVVGDDKSGRPFSAVEDETSPKSLSRSRPASIASPLSPGLSAQHTRTVSRHSNEGPNQKTSKQTSTQTSSKANGESIRTSEPILLKTERLPSGDLEAFPPPLSLPQDDSNPKVSSSRASRASRDDGSAKSNASIAVETPRSQSPAGSARSAVPFHASYTERLLPLPPTSNLTDAIGTSHFGSDTNGSAVPSNEARSRSPSAKEPHSSQTLHPNSLIYQMQRKVLSRDFWMKDENAKVCFNCGESFSTFRRKHHCRLCGQIYCNSCTNLISGRPFGQTSKLRVCRTCEGMLNEDDSSEYSEDDEPVTALPQRQIRFSDTIKTRAESPARSIRDKRADSDKSPIPPSGSFTSKRPRELRRTLTTGIEPIRQQTLARPSSSRSLKSLSGRPRSSSHKSHRSRHQHMRSLSFLSNEAPPFHRTSNASDKADRALPAFHTDSIIDPDLAPFMSDEESTDDDYSSISATLEADNHEQTPSGLNSILGALRRGRPRTPGKSLLEHSLAERDSDNMSITASRTGHSRRHLGNRTLSMGSIANYGSSPRVIKSDNLLRSSDNIYAMLHHFNTPERGREMKRESFISSDIPEKIRRSEVSHAELNPASLDHVKKLLLQFLRDANIGHTKRWERALIPILLRCAEEVDPSIHRGDDIDIRNYVKLKKAPGGSPTDSRYVSGIVFSKNVALRDMARSIREPRILLVSFPLIYARHQQHFMSLEGVIAQEREYLKNLSNRIIALRPSLVLVQGQVSGLVTGFLRDAGITVIYNVKSSVMQAASRCTQTRIVSSVDKLTMDPRGLGSCGRFDVKTHLHEQSKISHVYLSGCQKDLGCTIVLRGADRRTLSKVKWITEFMCYVTYNLKLETCLMRDQFISLPSAAEQTRKEVGGDTNFDQNDKMAETEKEQHSTEFGMRADIVSKGDQTLVNGKASSEVEKFDSLGSYDSTVRQLRQRLLSVSPFVSLAEPYLLLRGQQQEIQMSRLRTLQQSQTNEASPKPESIEEKETHVFELVRPEMVYAAEQNTSRHVREILQAVHKSEYEKALHTYAAIQRRWEMYIAGVAEPYSPLSHQKIIALFSIVSTLSSDACVGPDLLGLDFYQEHDIEEGCERDIPLGEYVERLCDQVDAPCVAGHCERKMIDHHRQYVHGDGQLIVSVEKSPSKFRNMENTILMWSCCRICEQETQVVPMSGDSWKYSFAKYLELSFWSRPLHPRAGTCLHDIHRDHVRYFGFKNMVIRVQYDPINLVEVTVPRGTITWAVDKDLRLKNEQYQRIEGHMGRFISSVKHRLKTIKLSSIEADKRDACKLEIEDLIKRANNQLEALTKNLQQMYMDSKFYEIVPLNRVLRHLQEDVAEWDTTFSDFEKNYFPSEKDLRKLAATQLKKAFLDQDDPISMTLEYESSLSEKTEEGGDSGNTDIDKEGNRTTVSSEGNSGALSSVVANENSALLSEQLHISGPDTDPELSLTPERAQIVQSLDLAVPESPPGTPAARPEQSLAVTKSNLTSTMAPKIKVSSPLKPESAADLEHPPPESAAESSGQLKSKRNVNAMVDSPRRSRLGVVPPLIRSQTQPTTVGDQQSIEPTPLAETAIGRALAESALQQQISNTSKIPLAKTAKGVDTKSTEKSGGTALKLGKSAMQSMIPRAISGRRYESKVSALAKHFEEMSREFEKERLRERLQRAARTRQSRALPLASAKPIVEVFKDASEAVREREPSYEELGANSKSRDSSTHGLPTAGDEKTGETTREQFGQRTHGRAEIEQAEDNRAVRSYPPSEFEAMMSDTEATTTADGSFLGETDDGLMNSSTGLSEYSIEIPKDEKSSLIKMLTSFWSERSASGWTPLDYPLVATAHVFADSDLIIREDEPSSLIAFTLASQDYKSKIQRFWERAKAAEKDKTMSSTEQTTASEDIDVERIMLGTTATHMRYQFQSGSSRMQCKVFYAESFDAIRRKCGVSDRFVESLSRCVKWDSKGGKTKSLFLKTHDERFVLKSLSPVETQAFLKFAPDYFDYMSKCLFHNLPSALAKMLGFYQVVIKNPNTGNEYNWFLQVMENVFYEGPSNRMFDLKGSMRNRKVQSTGQKDEVLLDENLLDYISQSPVYVRNHSNTVLASSIQNDTLFCSKQNVMDYSLIVGLYDDRKELLVGIIDYIRTYTWDKKLETWIKDRGKNKATVRSPKEYRARFRRSIPRYFPLAPSCWQVFGVKRIEEARARVEAMDAEDTDADEADEETDAADDNNSIENP